MVEERNEKAFFDALQKVADEIKKREEIVVVYHYDADGISSGAIAIKALEREGKKVSSLCLKQLYKENIQEIQSLGKTFLFVDFGSGQLDYLLSELGEKNIFILDHHNPLKVNGMDLSSAHHVNPLLFGIDGGKEISGAGTTFFFALALNKKNSDLAGIAMVGALGDMQDFSGELVGLNREILAIGQKEKIISLKKDLRLYGRISRPLISFLLFSSSPVLPELTAKEENCIAFLKENDIPLKDPFTDEWLSYEDLSLAQKKQLTSALIIHLTSFNVPEWKIKELIGEVYTLEKELPKSPLRDGKEFATLLNSCGRHKEPEVALAVCIGDRRIDGEYGKALALMAEHRTALRRGIEFINEHGIEERKSFYFFDSGTEIQDSLVGIIAGMLYGSVIQENKPIIALARNEDETVKISGRATSALVRKGINLGLAFKEIGLELRGVEGGGHKIAAGCKIEKEVLDEFLDLLEVKIFSQLQN